jgi:hypothetical protein
VKYIRHFLDDYLVGIGSDYTPGLGYLGGTNSTIPVAIDPLRYIGDRALPFNAAAVARQRNYVSLNAAAADAARADCETRCGFYYTVLPANVLSGVSFGARVSGTNTTSSGYFADFRGAANTIALVKGAAGVDSDLATAGFVFQTNVVYHAVFKVSGTAQMLKIWKDTDPEPSAWTVTAADATIAGAGRLQIGHILLAADTIGATILYVCHGTGTDSAPPRPVNWQEYLEYLNTQDALHCVLLEAEVLGRTSANAALPARVNISNMDFVSAPEDPYPNLCYEEVLDEPPRVSRRMSESFTGRSSITFGDAQIKNEIINPDALERGTDFVGRLDAWLSWNWDGRMCRMLLGHPTWRRSDFKTVFLGQTQNIVKSGRGRLALKLSGPEVLMKLPVSAALVGGTGPNSEALAPYLTGTVFNVKPVLYDYATLTYTVCSVLNGNGLTGMTDHTVRDKGGSLKLDPNSISAVNAGTDTLTSPTNHNLLVGATWVGSGGLPAPLVAGTKYYVKTVPSATTFTLSNTPGGAVIDITGTTTGGAFVGRLYDWGNGRITLLSPPAGDITMDVVNDQSISSVVFVLMGQIRGISAPYLAPTTLRGALITETVGVFAPTQAAIGDIADAAVSSVRGSFCIAREGTYFLTVLSAPAGPAAWTLEADEVANFAQGSRFLPAYVERTGYQKNFTVQQGGDLLDSITADKRDVYGRPYSIANFSPSETGLDQPANHKLAEVPVERETLLAYIGDAQSTAQRVYILRRKATGTYTFDTGGWALAAELGETILLTYPRDGFINGRYATIVGITDDVARGRAKIEIFCQIDGDWPVVTAADPNVSEAYF